MQATTAPSTTTLPSIKFLLESSVEMFNGDRQVSVEPRSPTSSYINTNNNSSSRKLILSLDIPSPKSYLISPVEESNMTEYHQKGNQIQNNLPRLPSIGQIDSVLNNNSGNRIITTTARKNSRPNSIQSLLSPPESPDMATNPFNDYVTHNNHVSAEQRPRLVHPQHTEYHYSKTTSPVYSSNIAAPLCTPPHYHQSYTSQSYVQPERGYERYHQERVTYDRSYTEHRAYSSSNPSSTALQPSYPPFESRSPVSTTLPPISPMLNNETVITRRLSAPISTKIINDTLTSPITGIVPSTSVNNNRYQCPYCSKRFSRPSSLRIHTYSHTGEKPFVCTEPGCGRKFSVQSNMRRHLRVHRLGRPVKKELLVIFPETFYSIGNYSSFGM
ncbi:C2H2-type zinc finger transcription factor [Rhizophagus clarus]|uniref:C2H2-type zinc finger transcription factor n=1 Tax=Rhizophagus clarus TaxID=94130 RepID=A0A8H3QQQ3_9GLOM|nr:C2H2-type zinc finger transcription factor [Rhizophagus clarus]